MLEKLEHSFQKLQFTRKHQQAFLEDLCSLIEDGVPASQAIDTIYSLARGPKKLVAKSIADSIARGGQIADGMEGWFSRTCVEMVRIGESSGTLEKTLHASIESFSQHTDALRVFISSMTYPIVVIIAASLVAVFIKNSVLNSFAQLKAVNFWPDIGKTLFYSAQLIQEWWWAVVLLIFIFIYILQQVLYRSTGSARLFIDRLPLLSLYRHVMAARLMESLGMLLKSGMPMKEALMILQRDASPYVQWHLLLMEYRLCGGKENIADVLDTHLLNDDDMIRLRVIAQGKSFSSALQSLGRKANERCIKMIATTGRMFGGVLLVCGAIMAAIMIYGIYTIGTVVAT